MATKHKCVQGASFAYDLSCDEVPTFDVNWGGSWAIVDALDDLTDQDDLVTRASGALVLSGDSTKLELRVPPTATNAIPVGSYKLVAQVLNASIGFSDEVMQDSFEITEQGIA